jgi:hypothetical protein
MDLEMLLGHLRTTMKKYFTSNQLKLLLLVSILFSATAFAVEPPIAVPVPISRPQQTPPVRAYQASTSAFPDNYQVMLTVNDKGGQPLELSVVIASKQFNVTIGEQNLNFSGSVSPEEEGGGVVIDYVVGWETSVPSGNGASQFRSSAQGSVRMKLAEEVQVFRAGSQVARISIKKIEPSKLK